VKPQHDRTADVDVVLDLRGAHDFAAAIARPPRADPRPDPEAGQTRQVPGDDPPFRPLV